jgi:hypothetical protein
MSSSAAGRGSRSTAKAWTHRRGRSCSCGQREAGLPLPWYEVGGWEAWAEFHPAYEAGDYAGVIDRARETLEASGHATSLYNLACCEGLVGRKQDAIGHLRVAFERRASLRQLAKEDSDLDPLRDEPACRELIG